jgi:hypothetical protein
MVENAPVGILLLWLPRYCAVYTEPTLRGDGGHGRQQGTHRGYEEVEAGVLRLMGPDSGIHFPHSGGLWRNPLRSLRTANADELSVARGYLRSLDDCRVWRLLRYHALSSTMVQGVAEGGDFSVGPVPSMVRPAGLPVPCTVLHCAVLCCAVL